MSPTPEKYTPTTEDLVWAYGTVENGLDFKRAYFDRRQAAQELLDRISPQTDDRLAERELITLIEGASLDWRLRYDEINPNNEMILSEHLANAMLTWLEQRREGKAVLTQGEHAVTIGAALAHTRYSAYEQDYLVIQSDPERTTDYIIAIDPENNTSSTTVDRAEFNRDHVHALTMADWSTGYEF